MTWSWSGSWTFFFTIHEIEQTTTTIQKWVVWSKSPDSPGWTKKLTFSHLFHRVSDFNINLIWSYQIKVNSRLCSLWLYDYCIYWVFIDWTVYIFFNDRIKLPAVHGNGCNTSVLNPLSQTDGVFQLKPVTGEVTGNTAQKLNL